MNRFSNRVSLVAFVVSLVSLALAGLATVVEAQSPRAADDRARSSDPPKRTDVGLSAERLYHGVNRPVMINVVSSRSFGTVSLVLMDFEGKPLAEPVTVYPGRVDLAERLPAIWNIRRTAYLQMIDLSQPVGSALVLQPMLSRMVPLTEVRTHPVTGRPSTRIVGWIDENDPSMLEPAGAASDATSGNGAASAGAEPQTPSQLPDRPPLHPDDAARREAEAAAAAAAAAEAEAARLAEIERLERERAKPRERLFTGLRIYPDRDVQLTTDKGTIRVCLRPDEAPNTAWNFMQLAQGGFYNGIVFHRVVPFTANGLPFVIQAGDPTAGGDGGPGYWLPIEPSSLPHDFGVISMARSDDPDSNGSQFFFCLSREGTARLDGQYCAFGYAVDGAATIRSIADVELADVRAGRPANPPMIEEAELVPAPPRTPGAGRPDARVSLEQAHRAATQPSGRVPR